MGEETIHRHCVLVVDDEPDICDSVHDLLRPRYDVVTANSAAEAMGVLGQREVHVLLTDQRMPTMTGTEMLRQVKTEYPHAIRVLFTGYADIHSVIDAINLGHVFRYLSKPFSPEELERAVDEAAAEYDRLASRARALSSCLCKVRDLEHDIVALSDRLARVERERTG